MPAIIVEADPRRLGTRSVLKENSHAWSVEGRLDSDGGCPAAILCVCTRNTDGAGQYRITGLNPGTYALTFRLSGFNIVKREGIELSGTATLTIPVEMRVGALEETITVTGETPVVDVQTASR